MLPPDVKIRKQFEDAQFLEDGTLERQIYVEFMVGKDGPFRERIRKTDYSADMRDALLTAFAAHVRHE